MAAGGDNGSARKRFADTTGGLRQKLVQAMRRGALDHHDADAFAELSLVGLGVLDMRQRIVLGLQVEDRRLSRREVLVAGGAIAGDALRRQHLGMPAFQPAARVVAGRKEGELQRPDALLVGQRRVGAGADRRAHLRRARRPADIRGDEGDRADELRPVGREHARHPVAEGVSDHESRAAVRMLDDRGHVGRAVVQIDPVQRTSAAADAARLRPQHPVAGVGQARRHRIEIGCAAPQRGQKHDDVGSLASLRQDLDPHVAACDHGSGRRRSRRSHAICLDRSMPVAAIPFGRARSPQTAIGKAGANALCFATIWDAFWIVSNPPGPVCRRARTYSRPRQLARGSSW
jgi:hypothetical protein